MYECFRAAFEQVSRLTFQPHQTDNTIDIRKTRLPSLRPEDTDYNPKDHRSPTHNIKYVNMSPTLHFPRV